MGMQLTLKKRVMKKEFDVLFGRMELGKIKLDENGYWFIPNKETIYDLRLSSYQLKLIADEIERLGD